MEGSGELERVQRIVWGRLANSLCGLYRYDRRHCGGRQLSGRVEAGCFPSLQHAGLCADLQLADGIAERVLLLRPTGAKRGLPIFRGLDRG